MQIAAVSGGLGGARFALALREAELADRATFITNVADDWRVDGLLVCPDTDAVLYALQGRFDEERGWGLRGDTFTGEATSVPWFSLGVQDRRHHTRRTQLLTEGHSLSAAIAAICEESGIATRVIPASNHARGTRVVSPDGVRAFQEWLVRDRTEPEVIDVTWPEPNHPSPGVLDALDDADVVVLTSSSPVASLEPTLTLDGVRETLSGRVAAGRRTVLISPVVGSTPTLERDQRRHRARAALLAARGVPHDPVAIAWMYDGLITDVILDPADAHRASELSPQVRVALAPIVDQEPASRQSLVASCLGVAATDRS